MGARVGHARPTFVPHDETGALVHHVLPPLALCTVSRTRDLSWEDFHYRPFDADIDGTSRITAHWLFDHISILSAVLSSAGTCDLVLETRHLDRWFEAFPIVWLATGVVGDGWAFLAAWLATVVTEAASSRSHLLTVVSAATGNCRVTTGDWQSFFLRPSGCSSLCGSW